MANSNSSLWTFVAIYFSTDNELTLWRMGNLKQVVLLSFEIAIISRESRPRGACEKEDNFYGEKPFLNKVSGQTLPLQALWFICIVNVCKLSFFIFSFFPPCFFYATQCLKKPKWRWISILYPFLLAVPLFIDLKEKLVISFCTAFRKIEFSSQNFSSRW